MLRRLFLHLCIGERCFDHTLTTLHRFTLLLASRRRALGQVHDAGRTSERNGVQVDLFVYLLVGAFTLHEDVLGVHGLVVHTVIQVVLLAWRQDGHVHAVALAGLVGLHFARGLVGHIQDGARGKRLARRRNDEALQHGEAISLHLLGKVHEVDVLFAVATVLVTAEVTPTTICGGHEIHIIVHRVHRIPHVHRLAPCAVLGHLRVEDVEAAHAVVPLGGEVHGARVRVDEDRILVIWRVHHVTDVLGLAPLPVGKFHHAVDVAVAEAAFAVADEIEGAAVRGQGTVRLPALGVHVASDQHGVAPQFTHELALVQVTVPFIRTVDEEGLPIGGNVHRGQVACGRVDVQQFRLLPSAVAVLVAHVNVLER